MLDDNASNLTETNTDLSTGVSRMNKLCISCLTLMLVAISGTVCRGEEVPKDIAPSFAARNESSQGLKYVWSVTEKVSVIPINSKFIAPGRSIGDDKPRTAQKTKELKELIKGDELINQATEIVERSGDLTHVYHTKYEGTPKRTSRFEEYFGDEYGLMFRYDGDSPAPESSVVFVWKTPANALYYRGPFQEGLNIAPEELVLISNANIMNLNGCQWQLLHSTKTETVIVSEVQKGNLAPYSITVTLDPAHDNAVTKIETKSPHGESRYEVSDYRRHDGQWVGSRIETQESIKNILVRRRTYTLSEVLPSVAVRLTIPDGSTVNDYRKHGDHMTTGDFFNTGKTGDNKSQFYSWNGTLPSEEELQKGIPITYVAPESKNNSWGLYAIGGVCLIGGGLVYFRARQKLY